MIYQHHNLFVKRKTKQNKTRSTALKRATNATSIHKRCKYQAANDKELQVTFHIFECVGVKNHRILCSVVREKSTQLRGTSAPSSIEVEKEKNMTCFISTLHPKQQRSISEARS